MTPKIFDFVMLMIESGSTVATALKENDSNQSRFYGYLSTHPDAVIRYNKTRSSGRQYISRTPDMIKKSKEKHHSNDKTSDLPGQPTMMILSTFLSIRS